MIIGIDPGLTGALVALDDRYEIVSTLTMPTMKLGTKNRINGAALAGWIRGLGKVRHAYLELVNAMPGEGKRPMGASSAFSFGHSAGAAECALQILGIPYTLISPSVWKKRAGLIGTEKDAARSRAIQLYPSLRELDSKTKGQAIADAILIARHGEQ